MLAALVEQHGAKIVMFSKGQFISIINLLLWMNQMKKLVLDLTNPNQMIQKLLNMDVQVISSQCPLSVICVFSEN